MALATLERASELAQHGLAEARRSVLQLWNFFVSFSR
jgi:hypothetical protein